MVIFSDDDIRQILAAVGKRPSRDQLVSAHEQFEGIVAAYLEDRSAGTGMGTSSRVADKLSKVAAGARSLTGTISYGDQAVNRRVRQALARSASRTGASAAEVADVLAKVVRLEEWASTAHREVRDESKWSGARYGGANVAVERLIGNLWDAYVALFDGNPNMSPDKGFVAWVIAYVERLLVKRPDLSELRRLSPDSVSAWRRPGMSFAESAASLPAKRP